MPEANDDAAVVIPARYASSRLPAKALALIGGRTMIERVAQQAALATLPCRVIVATDDDRILNALDGKAEARITRADHESGSDRVAEIAADLPHGIIVNVQGDLPLLDPALVDRLIERLRDDPNLGMATLAVPMINATELNDPNVVKLVCDESGRALYFSRAPIPFGRDDPDNFASALHHIGIYAYRRDTLLRFAALEPTGLEKIEKLEQLRALENGILIGVVIVHGAAPLGVDTQADLDAVRAAVSARDAAGEQVQE